MTARHTTEPELKLGGRSGPELPDDQGAGNGAIARPPDGRRADAVHFDTPDLRLRRRGVSVRFWPGGQPSGVWTLVMPNDAPSIAGDRRSISMPGGKGTMPAPIEDLVRGWAFGAPLAAVAGPTGPALAPWDLAPPAITVNPSAGVLIRVALVASAARLMDHIAAVALDEDPEGVHQARVAIRRLRSDLRTVRSLLHYRAVRPLRRELDWLMDQLGEVRDLDVLLAYMRTDSSCLDPMDRAGADAVLVRAREDRAAAHERLMTALRTPRCVALLEATAHLATAPPFRARKASRPAAEVLPRLARRRLKKLRQEVGRPGRALDDEALHRIRISVKRVRYAVELAAPAAGPKAERAARALADVQRVLGEHNDACVAGLRLRDLGSRAGPSGAWAAGLLGGLQLSRAAACRKRFPSVWGRAGAKKRWRWTKA